MCESLSSYINILEPRLKEVSNVLFMYREINPLKSYKQLRISTPESHKKDVLESFKIKTLLAKISKERNIPRSALEEQLKEILDEIGFEKELTVIRWLGLVLLKLLLRAFEGIFVNETAVFKLRSLMGNCPVIFVPSHRSYVDFNLMSYLCFHYDISTPVIAAGIDFKGMAVFGKLLRQVGAFYMRRSFSDTDFLYWEVFEQYIYQIVTKGDLPIEFFIEGTRSRTGKTLWPKYGLMTMVLKPFFTSQVSDIIFIPINISYDRVLEEQLFAYELLGVPKPKESTKGFFQSLRYLEQDYGNIYVTFSEPITASSFFNGKVDRSVHNLSPLHSQELTVKEKSLIPQFALEIVDNQQRRSVITAFNLIASVILCSYIDNKLLTPKEVENEVMHFKSVLEMFEARIACKDCEGSIKEILRVHKNLICLSEGTLQIVKNFDKLTYTTAEKLKGHNFSQEMMNFAMPFILLQEYVNPLMYFLVNPSLIACILKRSSLYTFCKEDVFGNFAFLRSLFSYEFVAVKREHMDFDKCWGKLIELNLIACEGENCYLGNNRVLLEFLNKLMEPFFITYYVVCSVIYQEKNVTEKLIISLSQGELENILNLSEHFIHPYILSLNSISNCIYSLTSKSAISRVKLKNEIWCHANPTQLLDIIFKLGDLLQGHTFLSQNVHLKYGNVLQFSKF